MIRIMTFITACSLFLAGCTETPNTLSDDPARISPVDYFILRASQAGTAEILADNCPRYRFDSRKEQQLKKIVIARVEGDKSLPATAAFIQELVAKARVQTLYYAKEYQQRNKLDKSPSAQDYCRVADTEVAAQSIIGQLLKRR